MATKKEYTIEELEAQYKMAEENQKALKNEIEKRKKEEAKLRDAKLAAEKDARKAEVDASIAHCKELIKKYMNDYGIYSFHTDDDSIFSSKFWNMIW